MSGTSLATGGIISPSSHPTASEIADAVWDEDLTTHNTAKSAGWIMRKIKTITDAVPGITRMR